MASLQSKLESGSRTPGINNPIERYEIGLPGQPTQLVIYQGKIFIYNTSGQTIIDGGYISTNAIMAYAVIADKLSVGSKKFVHTIVWTATDADTCNWSAGVITFADGSSMSINSGNTGNIANKNYIYYNGTATLQKTESYITAIGGNNIPLAIIEPTTDVGGKCIITPFVSVGTTIDGDTITTGKVQSVDGKTYFDLNNNLITINDGSNDRILIGKIGTGYGIKVSLPGYNASSDTDMDHFALWAMSDDSADSILIKEKVRGSVSVNAYSISTVAHGLGYVPFFMAFASDGTYQNWICGYNIYSNFNAWADDTNINFANDDSSARTFKYYIFYDEQVI